MSSGDMAKGRRHTGRWAHAGFLCVVLNVFLNWACGTAPQEYPAFSRSDPLIREDFAGPTLSLRWRDSAMSADTPAQVQSAVIQEGRLVLQHRLNHPVWLQTPLPRRFVLEMDLWPLSAQGDAKIEIAGDGQSKGGHGSYKASGYVLVFGGWNGSRHLIARQDEHGDEVRSRPAGGIDKGRRYHIRIERRDAVIRWFVDGRLLHQLRDERPLHGPSARYLGLSAWKAPVAFDSLRIYSLPRP